MRTYKSLSDTIQWSMIIVTILSISLVGSLWVIQEYRDVSAQLLKQKDDYIADKKTEIKTEVNRVIAYIDHKETTTEQQLREAIQARVNEANALANSIYNTYHGVKSDSEIQNMIKETLRPLIFNNNRGYFYIYDMSGNNVLLPFSPHLEGKNFWAHKDSKGQYVIQKITKMIREKGEGFQRWYWYKPGETERMSEKIGFSKYFAPYDWWIGTGEYIEDFQAEVQKEALEWINKIRFGLDGYIFIYHFDGTIQAHFVKETIGENPLKNTADPYGVKIVGDLIRISQQESGGFLEYDGFIRPSTGLRAQKIGFSRSVPNWQWVVGAGVYVDEINEVIELQRKNLIEKLAKDIFNILIIFVLSLFFIWVLVKYISGKITDHLTVFTRFFEQASSSSIKIVDDTVFFSEFKSLAQSANQMVDERQKAENELKRLRNYLANIIDSMPSSLVGVDALGHVTQWNRTVAQNTGISAETARGKKLTQLLPWMASEMENIEKSIHCNQIIQDQKRPRATEDGVLYEDITIYPLITNGVEDAVIRIDDVTEKVRIEEVMVQSEKMLSIGGLAAGMAHEINNPLASVIQTVEVMSNRLSTLHIPANRKAAEDAGITMESIEVFMTARGIPRMLTALKESSRRVADIVANMLSFARKGEAVKSSHSLNALLDKILELAATDYNLKKNYDFKKIRIQKDFEENLPLVVCEGSKIQQVLLNLVRNGAQAMQSAGIQDPTLIFRSYFEEKRSQTCIEVEDNGPGMDEATRKRVFEPFFTTKPVGVGTGLGLSVSYFIITENHGGEMDVESRPGAGTKFIIRLPASR